jgi:hypothetical protein
MMTLSYLKLLLMHQLTLSQASNALKPDTDMCTVHTTLLLLLLLLVLPVLLLLLTWPIHVVCMVLQQVLQLAQALLLHAAKHSLDRR